MSLQQILKLIEKEKERQEQTINLIASENYASPNVLKATGSVLTNKYAEGYPGKRYYAGCKIIDEIENLARSLGKKIFETEHINVQPHSGSSANLAVYLSCLKNNDTILGMKLSAGGHLTHGHKINFSGKIFNFIPYGLNPNTELLDYEEIEILAEEHKPKMIVAGASAYSRIIDYQRLRKIADKIKAFLFIDIAHVAGLIVAKQHPSPMPYADFVSSTTHKTLRGPRGGIICCKSEYAEKIDKAVMPGTQGGPLMHVIAAKAIAFQEASEKNFIEYQKQVIKNAQIMAQKFQELGYHIISGGTDTHLFLVNLKSKFKTTIDATKMTGKKAEEVLEKCNITLNRNLIPFDQESPLLTSGIRIGTAAITTRGFQENDCLLIAELIDEALKNCNNEKKLKNIKEKVSHLCKQHPIYQR